MEAGYKRWSKNSVAAKELKNFILQKGIHLLNSSDQNKPTAIDIWSSNPLYQQYSKNNFRTNYNRLVEKLRNELTAEDKMRELNGLGGK